MCALASGLLFSCGQDKQAKEENTTQTDTTAKDTSKKDTEETTTNDTAVDKEKVVAAHNNLRSEIETKIKEIKPVEVSTKELREKVKQKWSKIEFYVLDNQVVRVKTYPHENISKRTEEFYFKDGKLAIVTIEDDGSTSKDKEKGSIEKAYYYQNDKLVSEVNNSKETEFSIKNSEAEELLQEAKEYLEIYKSKK